jgi:predicted DNA-binding protein
METDPIGKSRSESSAGAAGIVDEFQPLYYSIAVLHTARHTKGDQMAMSVRLDPALEARVAEESRRLGITKSEFVKDSLERVLGIKNPADLLRTVRSGKAMGNPLASRNVSARMKAKLRAKLSD